MPRKKGSQPLTLIVVPHSERAPVSLSVPTHLLPLIPLLILALFVGVGLLGVRAYRLHQEVQRLQQERWVQLAREREMRNTILVQQEEVRGLSQQVEGFQTELAGVTMLGEEIRGLMGLPAPTATPFATPATYGGRSTFRSVNEGYIAAGDPDARGGQVTRGLSDRSMVMATDKSQDVINMQVTLPSTFLGLLDLREQLLSRMEKIEPEHLESPAELDHQLRLLAAAPSKWPTEVRRVSSTFGYRVLNGKLEFHEGIDLYVWYGSKVMATQDGVVVSAGWQGGYGWTVEIEHDMGFSTLYAHNSKLLVAKGDEVAAGDVIALSGNSGRSTGPHVHYEIKLNGVRVDPFKYLDTDRPISFTK